MTKVGPMSNLAQCVQSGERIRVHVRGMNRMRGFAVGTLVNTFFIAIAVYRDRWMRKIICLTATLGSDHIINSNTPLWPI